MPDARGRFLPGEHWRQPQAFREREWLEREYIAAGRSSSDIAAQFGVTNAAIVFWLRRHQIPRRSMSETRAIKRWGSYGASNPMFGRTGDKSPGWKGGITPDRQAFYSSAQWKQAVVLVWERDQAKCQRCRTDIPASRKASAIHHVISFSVRDMRAVLSNLVLMCAACHRWVHSKRNVDCEWLDPPLPRSGRRKKGGDAI